MVNKEKYADEILNIACSRFGFAVSKRTGKPCYCCDIDCKNQCLLYEEDDGVTLCLKNAMKWGNSKCTKQPTISKKKKRCFWTVLREMLNISEGCITGSYMYQSRSHS